MAILKRGQVIDFMGKRKLALVFSATLILIAFAALFARGLSLGIDFTGGTLIEVGYSEPANLDSVKGALGSAGYGDASVQYFGSQRDILIRLAGGTEEGEGSRLSNEVYAALSKAATGTVELRRVEFVGPQVGDELTEDGALAVLVALIAILMYVAMRFEWRFAVGSVVALVHDVVITVGMFALLQIEFDL
ncbi:MAG: protein translocase subunit SecF, partial [Gammaproteobacteria bacterium]|nr:protein translocase subunit SecF [Gammaproteobacteria bacterium]